MPDFPLIRVAAAVLEDGAQRVLLAQRPPGGHLAGLWEFPGGKIEPGEAPVAALRRELREELGVGLVDHTPLIRVRHRYPELEVELDVYRVRCEGAPRGCEGQALSWVAVPELPSWPMPAADRPVVNALRLPSIYRFTPVDANPEALLAQLDALPAEDLVQFRVFGLDAVDRRRLATRAARRCRQRGTPLLLNGDVDGVAETAAAGVHLNSRQLRACRARPLDESYWCAASCHDAAELRLAADLGFDFAVLSPVLPTPSHPDAEPLGWEAFAHLVDAAGLPVYALGGMRIEHLDTALAAGAQGIAGIRGLWPPPCAADESR